ncbi:MAG: hypothetical protein R3D71_03085 [Rickettsiales bacterium]
MADISFYSLSVWLLALSLCHFITYRISSLFPYSKPALNTRFPLFFGACLAPFLLGFTIITTMSLLPDSDGETHLITIISSLFTLSVCSFFFLPKAKKNHAYQKEKFSFTELMTAFLILGFSLLLIISSFIFPLTQTDALEYAEVGRILFNSNTLADYPPIHSNTNSSGMYLPITHPPLYAVMIYFSYLVQGNADMPIIMRLISPWLVILSTGLIYSLCVMINRRVGLLAALLFISTPLLFMSAVTSLIDPLSTLGFTMVFASIFCFRLPPIKLGLLQGAVIGLALWTHSQAILFPLLFIAGVAAYNGLRGSKTTVTQIITMSLSAALIGIWPYINNYIKFGSFISDSPLVFRLKNLAWDDYFLIGRGVDSLSAQIQYGFFKGWTAIEAYGIIFWIASLLVFCIRKVNYKKIYSLIIGLGNDNDDNVRSKIVFSAFVIVAAYHAGQVIAIALGINQLFRIERYMLIIVPCVAVIAGLALNKCFTSHSKTILQKTLIFGVLSVVGIQLIVFSCHLLKVNNLSLNNIGRSQSQTLMSLPEQRIISAINNLPEKSLILATQTADMYYTNKRMIGNLDPRLLNFYKTNDTEQGWRMLKKLGVTHIYAIPSALPSFYNSVMQSITSDKKFSKLLYDASGNQLYVLNNEVLDYNPVFESKLDLSPASRQWNRTTNLLIGGRKSLARIPLSTNNIEGELRSDLHFPLRLFQRDISTSLEIKHPVQIQQETQYQLKLGIKGYGLIRIWLTYCNNDEEVNKKIYDSCNKKYLLTETILSKKYSERNVVYRFITPTFSKYLKIAIEHYGNSRIKINKALLSEHSQQR